VRVEPAAKALTTHCWIVVRGVESVECSIFDDESSMGGCAGAGISEAFDLFSDGCGGMSICDRRAYGRGENSRRLEPPTQAQQHFSRAIL
jgi:hypothetical protein